MSCDVESMVGGDFDLLFVPSSPREPTALRWPASSSPGLADVALHFPHSVVFSPSVDFHLRFRAPLLPVGRSRAVILHIYRNTIALTAAVAFEACETPATVTVDVISTSITIAGVGC
jgi:hypothetical protein